MTALGTDTPMANVSCPACPRPDRVDYSQLRPGDTVRFQRLSQDHAHEREAATSHALATLRGQLPANPTDDAAAHYTPVIYRNAGRAEVPEMVVRQAGDRYLLVEFGPLVLDIELRLRVHVLMTVLQEWQKTGRLHGVIDTTPGIRSLQLHFDPAQISQQALLQQVIDAEAGLPAVDDMVVPSRTVHLPLSWDDPQTRIAIEKYMQSVRSDAPWCPSNIEFIRRINGLHTVEDVYRTVFDASYLVLGLGDVYLGAPVATPLDPRHRLVTTKYNPARTWTPENAVGIGGAYLCVYGMEGPGGYQFVGRTLQMWNRWHHGQPGMFEQPWLLRFFDQIRFYPVGQDELQRLRAGFPSGGYQLQIDEGVFSLRDYRKFLADEALGIDTFRQQQQASFEAERQRWVATGQDLASSDVDLAGEASTPELDLPQGGHALTTSVPGSVWKVSAHPGQTVKSGDVLMVIESMKMEFNLIAPSDATVHQLFCQEGASVTAGQTVLVLIETTVPETLTQ